jgi:hypothetical protein
VPAQGAEGYVLRIGRTADAATQSVTAVAEMLAAPTRCAPAKR